MNLRQAISEYRPIYFVVHSILKGCDRFHLPLSRSEAKDVVLFGGAWYDGRGLTSEQLETIHAAHLEFRKIQEAHKGVVSCDPTDPDGAFKIATGYERKGFILSEAWLKQNAPTPDFSEIGDAAQE